VALNMFLQIDGIQGTETDTNHKGAIDVLAYSWGMSHNPPVGQTQPKPNFQDFSLTIYEDVYSPLLFKACISGAPIKTASLSIVKVGSDTPADPNVAFVFTGVRVTSLSSGASGGEDRPTQNLSLDYATVRYTVADPPVPPGQSNTYGWNVAQGRALGSRRAPPAEVRARLGGVRRGTHATISPCPSRLRRWSASTAAAAAPVSGGRVLRRPQHFPTRVPTA
jgi:type VI secretion system secreted protein Hcp